MQTNQTLNDHALVKAYQRGNEQALTTLVQMHKQRVFSAIYMFVRDRYIAEDLFQDTCIKVISKIREGKYTEDGKFCPWALRIARNLTIDYLRVSKRMVKVTLPDGRDICELLGLEEPNREDSLMRGQAHARVRSLLNQIPYEQRETLVLRLYGNHSFREIAELTGVSLNTALGRMRYGLINLRKIIEQKSIVL